MRTWMHSLLGVCALAIAGPAIAQAGEIARPAGQLSLAVATEGEWRGLVLSDGTTLRTGIAIPLVGQYGSVQHWNGVQLELEAWNPLDASEPATEQYAAALRLQLHPRGLGGEGTQFGVVYRAYIRPDESEGSDVGHEAGITAVVEAANAAAGLQGVYVVGEVIRGFEALEGTYLRGGLQAQLATPTFQWFDLEAALVTSASDYPGLLEERAFGHHATQLSGALRFPNLFRSWLGPRRSLVPVIGGRYTWRAEALGENNDLWFAELRARW